MSAYDRILEHTDSYLEDPEKPHRPGFSPQYDVLPHVSHPHRFGEPCSEFCTLLPPVRGVVPRPRRIHPSIGEEA